MTAENQILAGLSADVLERLRPHLKPVNLVLAEIIHRPGEPLSHLYFPIDCLFSITLTMQDGATAEVGIVGNRGVLGINALMGNRKNTQTEYMVQGSGSAMKIDVQVMRQEFKRYGELHDLLLRYSQAFLAQVSQTAACNSLHTLEQRLPRWLLEVQARIDSDHLPLTQTAQKLQERKVIRYRRGNVNILNQGGLEASACECFKSTKAEYDRCWVENNRHLIALCTISMTPSQNDESMSRPSPRIFVLEPDDEVRPLLKQNLQMWGYQVTLAIDEADALQRVEGGRDRFELILLNQYQHSIEHCIAIGQQIR